MTESTTGSARPRPAKLADRVASGTFPPSFLSSRDPIDRMMRRAVVAALALGVAPALASRGDTLQPRTTVEVNNGGAPEQSLAPPSVSGESQPEAMWDEPANTGKPKAYLDPLIAGETDLVWQARAALPPGIRDARVEGGAAEEAEACGPYGCPRRKVRLEDAELKSNTACGCEATAAATTPCPCAGGAVEADLLSDRQYVRPEEKDPNAPACPSCSSSSSSSSSGEEPPPQQQEQQKECACLGEVECPCRPAQTQAPQYADEAELPRPQLKTEQPPPTEQRRLLEQRKFEGPPQLRTE